MSYAVGGDTGPDSTLPLFGSTEYSDGAAMLFSGGPVWSMDWLNAREDGLGEQYVALTAYQDYDEVVADTINFNECGDFCFGELHHYDIIDVSHRSAAVSQGVDPAVERG